MNIQEIKQNISAQTGKPFPKLDMARQLTEDKLPTSWYSHWDNVNRVRVVMHEDIFNKLVENTSMEGLALKPMDTVTPEGKPPYTRFVVITPTSIEASF